MDYYTATTGIQIRLSKPQLLTNKILKPQAIKLRFFYYRKFCAHYRNIAQAPIINTTP
ncbi:hypothetical protein CERZMDRAFT_90412 [Cercospora zeae-maydis SCOH1-5]|uniref:Uncharacterized protein n=1 Tax=Cercospora zeae-maydis SCOH1-5 TaxID=717836 RepID=A0A6A6FKV9_9PEZI|nr:hypothetical protein CERZMDRAFT_90412 [Cercospora zeae-maydis SCOH1-5]